MNPIIIQYGEESLPVSTESEPLASAHFLDVLAFDRLRAYHQQIPW